jgi:hypothetical protein
MVRFQVLTAANMKMTVFWDVAPCSLVEVYRRFRGTYCLNHQGDDRSIPTRLHGAISQKTVIIEEQMFARSWRLQYFVQHENRAKSALENWLLDYGNTQTPPLITHGTYTYLFAYLLVSFCLHHNFQGYRLLFVWSYVFCPGNHLPPSRIEAKILWSVVSKCLHTLLLCHVVKTRRVGR